MFQSEQKYTFYFRSCVVKVKVEDWEHLKKERREFLTSIFILDYELR